MNHRCNVTSLCTLHTVPKLWILGLLSNPCMSSVPAFAFSKHVWTKTQIHTGRDPSHSHWAGPCVTLVTGTLVGSLLTRSWRPDSANMIFCRICCIPTQIFIVDIQIKNYLTPLPSHRYPGGSEMVLGGTLFLALILPGYLTYCIRNRSSPRFW